MYPQPPKSNQDGKIKTNRYGKCQDICSTLSLLATKNKSLHVYVQTNFTVQRNILTEHLARFLFLCSKFIERKTNKPSTNPSILKTNSTRKWFKYLDKGVTPMVVWVR